MILVAPLEPKVKINKTLQINDLWRFSFVKNRHFWCKMPAYWSKKVDKIGVVFVYFFDQ